MPFAPLRPCSTPGCGKLGGGGRCEEHRLQHQRQAEAQRESAHKRGYGARWQKASKGWLRSHPLCACPDCEEGRKRITLATVVDHKVPHKGDMALFWDRNNWQSMAKVCHDKKTALEDGGFGHAPARGVGG